MLEIKKIRLLQYSLIFSIIIIVSILLYLFNRFDEILYFPTTIPEEWCDNQPCVQIEIFSTTFTLVQPSSTILVYLLGIITISIGLYLLKGARSQNVVSWWGIALLLWGLGALFAGTSYQAFSYEIKCAGRTSCIWTSWWEVMYLILSVGSVVAMMMAQANLAPEGKYYTIMCMYAFIDLLYYSFVVVIGSILLIQVLITFELMIVLLAPNIVFFILFNWTRWRRLKQPIDKYLMLTWVFLIIIMGAYFLYYMSGLTEILWAQGIWFSENDVLHIGLIFWMLYIGVIINKFRKNNQNVIT